MQTFLPLTSRLRPSHLRLAVRRWAVSSQQIARRNAMVACTECADRRALRLDVESFLEAASAPRTQGPVAAHG